jgi:hypothetical protein
MNITQFQDFGINSLQEIVTKFDEIVNNVREPIVKAVDSFQKIIALAEGDGLQGLVNKLTTAIRDLPDSLAKAIERIKNLIITVSHYDSIPWVKAIKAIVTRVDNFITDIKTDIMGLYTVRVLSILATLFHNT